MYLYYRCSVDPKKAMKNIVIIEVPKGIRNPGGKIRTQVINSNVVPFLKELFFRCQCRKASKGNCMNELILAARAQ